MASAGALFTKIDVPGANYTAPAGINATGQIVGSFNDAGGFHGFLYSGGIFSTIDVPGASGRTAALGINDSGQIVGSGSADGFLYTPTPEPSCLTLLGVGLTVLAAAFRRRQTPA